MRGSIAGQANRPTHLDNDSLAILVWEPMDNHKAAKPAMVQCSADIGPHRNAI